MNKKWIKIKWKIVPELVLIFDLMNKGYFEDGWYWFNGYEWDMNEVWLVYKNNDVLEEINWNWLKLIRVDVE